MQKSLNFWIKEEFDRFISTFDKSDPFYVAFLTLYYTGMRIGELQALTLTDLDLGNGIIHINKTYAHLFPTKQNELVERLDEIFNK